MYSRIVSTGKYLPERILTNADLEKMVETTDEWIRSRTGIEVRHIAADDEATSDLAYKAGLAALQDSGLKPSDIDLVLVGTTTPDLIFPNVACLVQEKLKISGCPAFSLEAACSGFLYGLVVADQFIRTGQARRALVIGAETMSRIIDWKDRETCVLFGDGSCSKPRTSRASSTRHSAQTGATASCSTPRAAFRPGIARRATSRR
jgi:3-oxoacyl-[acyl-carrier-protein] synthase-3